MDRGAFLAGTGAVLLAALGPRIATPQTSSRTPTIGLLALSLNPIQNVWDPFTQLLRWQEIVSTRVLVTPVSRMM
jgi:hypothetical protein